MEHIEDQTNPAELMFPSFWPSYIVAHEHLSMVF